MKCKNVVVVIGGRVKDYRHPLSEVDFNIGSITEKCGGIIKISIDTEQDGYCHNQIVINLKCSRCKCTYYPEIIDHIGDAEYIIEKFISAMSDREYKQRLMNKQKARLMTLKIINERNARTIKKSCR
jgi:hypothetical protein